MRLYRLVPAPSVVTRPVLDEVVLIDVTTGASCALDAAGGRLWDLLVSCGDWDDVERQVALDHPARPERVSADLERFIDDLERQGFVQRLPAAPDGRGPAPPDRAR
jgi:Coenzyme PQQ synthesis protein D (PqqD)